MPSKDRLRASGPVQREVVTRNAAGRLVSWSSDSGRRTWSWEPSGPLLSEQNGKCETIWTWRGGLPVAATHTCEAISEHLTLQYRKGRPHTAELIVRSAGKVTDRRRATYRYGGPAAPSAARCKPVRN